MHIAMIVVHVAACIAVILVVLLSKGKGADLGAAFGGSSQTVFGSQGAGGVLTKLVAICVAVFMMTSLGLAYMSSNRTDSTVMPDTESTAPAKPGTKAPADTAPGTDTEPVIPPMSEEAPAADAGE